MTLEGAFQAASSWPTTKWSVRKVGERPAARFTNEGASQASSVVASPISTTSTKARFLFHVELEAPITARRNPKGRLRIVPLREKGRAHHTIREEMNPRVSARSMPNYNRPPHAGGGGGRFSFSHDRKLERPQVEHQNLGLLPPGELELAWGADACPVARF